MCWYCCISLRGAVYFGTSIHIFVGLVLMVHWAVNSYIALFINETLLTNVSALLTSVLCGFYTIFFILLGCIIFSGTERESVSLLKWSSAGFTMLQTLVFTLVMILYLIAPEGVPILANLTDEMRILAIIMYFCCLVATANYILVLFLYIRKLWRTKTRRGRSSSSTSRAAGALNNIRISGPIQQQQQQQPSTSIIPNDYLQQRYRQQRTAQSGGIESPGIYESLDAPVQHPFFPANFYSGYRSQQESIYNGGSIRSGSGSVRSYPYPHERHREPVLNQRPQSHQQQLISGVPPSRRQGEDWTYGHRLQVFQRGLQERSSGTNEPLLNTSQHHHHQQY